MTTPEVIVYYRGFRRDGSVATGSRTATPDVVAKELFDKGWKSAHLTCGGREVGAVGTFPPARYRTWWAETGPGQPVGGAS